MDETRRTIPCQHTHIMRNTDAHLNLPGLACQTPRPRFCVRLSFLVLPDIEIWAVAHLRQDLIVGFGVWHRPVRS